MAERLDLLQTLALAASSMRVNLRSMGWTKLCIICACLLALPACSPNVVGTLEKDGGPWMLERYDNGRLIHSETVDTGSRRRADIINWAKANANGWRPSLSDYAPGVVVFSASFKLNLRSGFVVFGRGHLQYERSLASDEGRKLDELLTDRAEHESKN